MHTRPTLQPAVLTAPQPLDRPDDRAVPIADPVPLEARLCGARTNWLGLATYLLLPNRPVKP